MLSESGQNAPLDSTLIAIDNPIRPAEGSMLDEFLARAKLLDSDDCLCLIAAIWASLPPSHPAALNSTRLLQLQRSLDAYEQKRVDKFPWEVLQALVAGEIESARAKIYSVPRRFDLATIFVVTLAYSLLFGTMKAISFPPMVSAIVAGFISIVGVAQALLYGGEQPRKASIIAGAVVYTLAMATAWIISGPRLYSIVPLVISASFTIAGGAFLGYLAGVFVGGVFLVAEKLRNLLARRQAAANVDSSAANEAGERGYDPWTN